MKSRTGVIILIVVLAGVVMVRPIFGRSESIIITGADLVQNAPLAASAELGGLAGVIGPRFSVNYANLIQYETLEMAPAALQTHLGRVSARLFINYAQRNRRSPCAIPLSIWPIAARRSLARSSPAPSLTAKCP